MTLRVRDSLAFAVEAHTGQFRRGSGLPYYTHPLCVYGLVKKYKESRNIEDILCASVLHDVIEDCRVTPDTLRSRFGPLVADLVVELTNDRQAITDAGGKRQYMRRKLQNLSSYALVIKLCDILDNLTDNPVDNQAEYVEYILSGLPERELSRTHRRILRDIHDVLAEITEQPSLFTASCTPESAEH